MSTLPARTRSIRKPVVDGEQQGNINTPLVLPASSTLQNGTELSSIPGSPSRLPVKPFGIGHGRGASTSQLGRTAAANTLTSSMRPPPPRSNPVNPAASVSMSRPRPLSMTASKARPLSMRSRTPDSMSGSTSTSSSTSLKRTTSIKTPVSQVQRAASISSTSSSVRPPPSEAASSPRHSRHASTSTLAYRSRMPAGNSAVGHSRTKSSIQPDTFVHLRAPSGSTALHPPSRKASVSTTTSDSSDFISSRPAQARPNFSTLQQHFSPAKSLGPKPLSSTFLVPPSPSKHPSNIATTAELAKLQAELLQLHIMHRDAKSILTQYEKSAEAVLQAKFDGVADRVSKSRKEEAQREERRSLAALRKWREDSVQGWGIEEKLMVLAEALSGITTFTDGNSKFQKSIRRFEGWMMHVLSCLKSRGQGEMSEIDVNALDEHWRIECESLLRKLVGWNDRVQALGEVEGTSALERTVTNCQSLIEGMVSEIQCMLRIHREVGKKEREWISSMCDEDSDDEGDLGRTVGGAWRS